MTALNSSSLETAILAIFKDNIRANDYGFRSDMRVENLFSVSYKARYFLELLQNSRDAIVEGGVTDGKVRAWIADDILYFANNGADFSEEGVWSICYPAVSTKNDLTMVGHKGIGFNAVREISVTPEIITRFGTIFFDVENAKKILGRESSELPLFRYPMFKDSTLRDAFPELALEGFTTVFKFPVIDELKVNHLDLGTPKTEDLIFLSAIKELDVNGDLLKIEDNGSKVEVCDAQKKRNFIKYPYQFELSAEEIAAFSKDEQAQFKSSNRVECIFLLEQDEKLTFVKSRTSNLHLFYGLDFLSGLSFALHSYFSVTIERKSLVPDSKLNMLLFQRIATYYTTDFLDSLKKDFPGQELSIIAFSRQSNNRMDRFYDFIRERLKNKDFIYNPQLNRYFRPEEIVLVSKDDYNVFRDGELAGKYLMISCPEDLFLIKELKVESLNETIILKGIEAKCEQYRHDPKFFEDLYGLIFTKRINASSKKILLSASGNLLTGSQTDIFYQVRTTLTAPVVLESDIAFLHQDIEVENIRSGLNKFLGLNEYNEAVLLKRAVKILIAQDASEPGGRDLIIELLHFILQFDIEDHQLLVSLKNNLKLPVVNATGGGETWTSPLSSPLYFENFSYSQLYRNVFRVVDFNALRIPVDAQEKWKKLFLRLGVWDIPAVFSQTGSQIHEFYPGKVVSNNATLHLPEIIDESFFDVVRLNWNVYEDFITADKGSANMTIEGSLKPTDSEKIKYSDIVSQLSKLRWIPATKQQSVSENRQTGFYAPGEIVLLGANEAQKNHNSVIFDFFAVSQLDRIANAELIQALDIILLQPGSIEECMSLLEFFRIQYPEPEKVENQKGLKNLSNRLLSFMYEYLNKTNQARHIEMLKKQYFLAEGILNGRLIWLQGAKCLHIDDKNFLDVLIENDLLESLSDPYAFTKKDKKEWGKFGNKIGRSVRKMVKTRLISDGVEKQLFDHIYYPDVLLAFIENDLDKNYTDEEILSFGEETFHVHHRLEMSYSLEEKTHPVLQSFYVLDGKKPILHISRDCLENKHLLSLAVADWVDHIAGRELIRFYLIIERLSDSRDHSSAQSYARDHDIDQQRMEHIQHLLFQDYLLNGKTTKSQPIPAVEKITATPISFKSSVVVVTQEKQQINFEMGEEMQHYFNQLQNKVFEPTQVFKPRVVPSKIPANDKQTILSSNHSSPRLQGAELSDQGKTDVGFLAEMFVHLKLQAGEETLLGHLGIDQQTAQAVEWLNLHRKTDYSLPDRSRGHGHDFINKSTGLAIEVKGMLADTGYITVTGKEVESMRSRGDSYYLIVVRHILKGSFIPEVIQNPYDRMIKGQLFFVEAKISL